MEFDPYEPYGPVVESTLRIVTWNVWARYGDAAAREDQLRRELVGVQPDIACLTEAWAERERDQAGQVAGWLAHDHCRHFGARPVGDSWSAGIAITSRWPITEDSVQSLTGLDDAARGLLGHVEIDGPRGPIQVFGVMLDYPLGASAARQHQVRQVLDIISAVVNPGATTILCGDFNAPPDSDELRMLTGRTAAPHDIVFYDAWEVAGDGGPGITFARDNPHAVSNLFPDRRFDYVLSAWPRAGGRGHPVKAEVVGRTTPPVPLRRTTTESSLTCATDPASCHAQELLPGRRSVVIVGPLRVRWAGHASTYVIKSSVGIRQDRSRLLRGPGR